MTQKREPKGVTSGGQFAASVNPESTVELSEPRDYSGEIIAEHKAAILDAEQSVEATIDSFAPAALFNSTTRELYDNMRTSADRQKEIIFELESRLRTIATNAVDDGAPDFITEPLTGSEIRERLDSRGFVTGRVLVHLRDVLDSDIDDYVDHVSERLVGMTIATNVSHRIVGSHDGDLVVEVSCDPSNVLSDYDLNGDDPAWDE